MAVVGIALWLAAFVIAIGFEPLQVESRLHYQRDTL